MSYENKEYILQFFEGVHEKDNKAELLEVYQKAKAWDKLMAEIDRITAKSLEGNLPPNISMSAKSLALSIAKKEYESGE